MVSIGALLTAIISLAPSLGNLTLVLNDLFNLLSGVPQTARKPIIQGYLLGHLRREHGAPPHSKDLLSVVQQLLPLILQVLEEMLSYGTQRAGETVQPPAGKPTGLPAVPSDDPAPAA